MKISRRGLSGNLYVTTIALESLGNRAYIVENSNKAVLIDPPLASWAIENYLKQTGLKVVAILDTHIHNDFVSGSPGLSEKYSVPYFAPTFGERKVRGTELVLEGESIDFDGFGVTPAHTPGHTLDHHSYLLSSESNSKAALFSGGSWLQGSLGRVDLDQSASPEELARLQVMSLEKMLGMVQDDTLLMPTHGFGSYCSYGSVTIEGDTVADDKARNPYFHSTDAEKLLLSNPLPVPPHFRRMASINIEADRRNEITDFDSYFSSHISEDLSSAVDARSRRSRLRHGNLGLSVLGIDGPFPVWFGWLDSIVGSEGFVVDNQEEAELLTEGLVSIGESSPKRYIVLGDKTNEVLRPVAYREQDASSIELAGLHDHLLIDLRHRGEWLLGHLVGSRNMPFEDYSHIPEELNYKNIAVYCGSGYRASMFLSSATAFICDRVSINGSTQKHFSQTADWCRIPHEGSVCDSESLHLASSASPETFS